MTEQVQEKAKATVTTHLVKDGEVVVTGKRVAIVPESMYEKNMCCPHCKSTAKPDYLSDLQNLPETIADLLKCSEPECGNTFVVLAHPRTYLLKPILLNWELTGKGGETNGAQKEEPATTEAATT